MKYLIEKKKQNLWTDGIVQAWLTRADVHTLAPLPNPANQSTPLSHPASPASTSLRATTPTLSQSVLSPAESTQHTTVMDSVKDAVGMGDNGPKTRTSHPPQTISRSPRFGHKKDVKAGFSPALWEDQPE